MGVTIVDVATAAGVSTATVSRALRGLPNVEPSTRQRVLDAARRLDYVVSPSAARLASGRTGSVAIITPSIARWFFATVLSGVESVLQSTDTDLLVFRVGDPSEEPPRMPAEQRLRRRVDAALLISLPLDDPSVRPLLGTNLPLSLVGAVAEGLPSFAIDDLEAARTATGHLVARGHERIAVIAGQQELTTFSPQDQRLAGYEHALATGGLPVDPALRAHGDFTMEGGERAMCELLDRPAPPTAVFAMSDEMAFGALWALRRHGLVPGRDVDVVGIDGHPMAPMLGLTTVEQPVAELGRLAATAILERLRARDRTSVPSAPVVLPTRLVVRESAPQPQGPRRARAVAASD